MWSNREKSMGFASGGTTLISKSTELIGDVSFSGNLEIEGKIRGNIHAEEGSGARIRIMDQGLVEGEIHVPVVVVNGVVNGDVYSSKHIELAAKAQVNGNVHYSLIEMVKGAQVNGSLVYHKDSQIERQATAPDVESELGDDSFE